MTPTTHKILFIKKGTTHVKKNEGATHLILGQPLLKHPFFFLFFFKYLALVVRMVISTNNHTSNKKIQL
jgi:hypothetical protein